MNYDTKKIEIYTGGLLCLSTFMEEGATREFRQRCRGTGTGCQNLEGYQNLDIKNTVAKLRDIIFYVLLPISMYICDVSTRNYIINNLFVG